MVSYPALAASRPSLGYLTESLQDSKNDLIALMRKIV